MLAHRRQRGLLNLFHPEIRAHALLGERADECEHLVGEATDVQDVMAVSRQTCSRLRLRLFWKDR